MSCSENNRRTALQLAAQLPDNSDDAREVLRLAEEIVDKFFVPSTQSLRVVEGDNLITPNFTSVSKDI